MNERLVLLTVCAVAAIASAAVVLNLDNGGSSAAVAPALVREPSPAIRVPKASSQIAVNAVATHVVPVSFSMGSGDRLAFVPTTALPLEFPAVGDEWFVETAETDEAEDPASWSAETQPVRLRGPRLPPSEARRLPWQTPASLAPSRSYTLKERLEEISPAARTRLAAKFEAAGAVWPPAEVALVAIKDQKVLELFARPSGGGAWKLVHRYSVLAASGRSGPKLRQGDKQVPEGVYGISFLNPNSRYHVSLRVNYPNAFDRKMAMKDGRKNLGGDIMIHGKKASIGCLAIGDAAAEEMFVLAAHIGLPQIKLIIAPTDFRKNGVPAVEPGQPEWLPKLYTQVASAMSEFKAPPTSIGLLSLFDN